MEGATGLPAFSFVSKPLGSFRIQLFLMSSAKGEMKGEMAADDPSAQSVVMGSEHAGHLSFDVGQATRPMPPMFESSWSVEQVTYKGLPENPLTSIPVAKRGELMGFIIKQDLDRLQTGVRVQAVFKEEREGNILDVDCFRIVDGKGQ